MAGRAKAWVATGAVMLAGGLAMSACAKKTASNDPAQVCSSQQTTNKIRDLVFAKAANAAGSSSRYAIPRLAPQSKVSVSRPLVEAYDQATRKTSCTGVLNVDLPAGVLAVGALRVPIRFSSQPLADGSGVSFDLSGADEVVASIAGADLTTWAATNAKPTPGLVVEYAPGASPAERAAGVSAVGRPVRTTTQVTTQETITTPIVTAQAAPAPKPPVAPKPLAPKPVAAKPVPAPPSPPRAVAAVAKPPPKRPAEALTPAPVARPATPAHPVVVADARRRAREAEVAGPPEPPARTRPPLPPLRPAPPFSQVRAGPLPAAPDGPVRVFVHIAGPSSRAQADAVRGRLNDLLIAGAPVSTPAVRVVARTPRRNEVRCLKAADCAVARRVGAYLAGYLPGGVTVVDMSRTYESDPGVRRGSLELWLKPTGAAAPSPYPPDGGDDEQQ